MRPLDGVRFKLTRAQEHADALHAQVEAYFEQVPKPYETRMDLDQETGEFAMWITVREEPNPHWGVVIGDFLHNVRSALDHLMAALVTAEGNPVTHRTQFPIFTERMAFEARAAPMMDGASAAARAVIEELQPFQVSHPDEHPLEILRRLSNTDKHRLLFAVIALPKEVESTITKAVGTQVEIHETVDAAPLEGETLVMRGRVVPGADFEALRMSSQLIGSVVLSDGTPFEDFVEPALSFVRDQVASRLEAFAEQP
jgi:hypothetical protein